MKRIAIVTLYGNFNYGNKLQNYAVQKILSKRGFETYTLKLNENKGVYKELRYRGKIVKRLLVSLINSRSKNDIKREALFKEFNRYHLNYYNKTVNIYRTEDLNDKFDYFVVGSDQVWNPNYLRNPEFFLLGFADDNKIVSISPSFGVSNIGQESACVYKKLLPRFKMLSVREENGRKIIHDLVGKDAEVLIDPTLMLEATDWKQIGKRVSNVPEKFIVTYFLDGMDQDSKAIIQSYSLKYNLPILDIANSENPEFYITGPSEFVYLISKATLVCTNSFHGCIFALIFNKPMVIFDRKVSNYGNMNSRIQTLQDKFLLHDRHIKKIDEEKLFYANYSHSNKILVEEKRKFDEYLGKQFN